MSDFQDFLNDALKKVEIQTDMVEEQTIEYNIYEEIAEQLLKARNELGISQKELAERSGLTQANISRIESGSSHPTIDSIKRIADSLGKRVVFRLIEQEGLNDYD